jgi:hypothetical protein
MDEEGDMVMNGIIPDEDNIERINLAELLLLTRIENDMQQIDLDNNDNTFLNFLT